VVEYRYRNPCDRGWLLPYSFVGARPLLVVTGLLVLAFGVSFLFFPKDRSLAKKPRTTQRGYARLTGECDLLRSQIGVGLISGLLANAGGFLLVPCYTVLLRQPMKKAFACSLAVSAVLAVPGTAVHAYLGHISWLVTSLVAMGSIPFSFLGARLAIKTRSAKLERWYGLMLTCLGMFFLFHM
jgi:uncharacterized protein